MRKILVTGAAGFIGSHTAEALASAGHDVVGLDNFDPYYPRERKEANLRALRQRVDMAFYEADIRDQARLSEILHEHGVDLVVHLAAKAGIRPSIAAARDYVDVNVGGTTALLEASRQAEVKSFIFASSSSVYGGGNVVPFSEDQPIATPLSPYAATKAACEDMCFTYHHLYGLDMACLRFFTVYGPRQRPDLAINKFVRLMSGGQPLSIYGDGSSTRDYTYVDDIVRGILATVEKQQGFSVMNLGSGHPISVMDLVSALERALETKATVHHSPFQPGDMPHTWADTSRAKAMLGWEPTVALVDGLRSFVRWYQECENAGDGD